MMMIKIIFLSAPRICLQMSEAQQPQGIGYVIVCYVPPLRIQYRVLFNAHEANILLESIISVMPEPLSPWYLTTKAIR